MRLRLNPIIIGAAVAWALCLAILQWVNVYFGASPRSALAMGVMLFMWPVPGVIRFVRQCQRQKDLPEWMDERKLLLGLSLTLMLLLALSTGRYWWLWSVAAGVWSITFVYTFVNSRVGVALFLRLFKGQIRQPEEPTNSN